MSKAEPLDLQLIMLSEKTLVLEMFSPLFFLYITSQKYYSSYSTPIIWINWANYPDNWITREKGDSYKKTKKLFTELQNY